MGDDERGFSFSEFRGFVRAFHPVVDGDSDEPLAPVLWANKFWRLSPDFSEWYSYRGKDRFLPLPTGTIYYHIHSLDGLEPLATGTHPVALMISSRSTGDPESGLARLVEILQALEETRGLLDRIVEVRLSVWSPEECTSVASYMRFLRRCQNMKFFELCAFRAEFDPALIETIADGIRGSRVEDLRISSSGPWSPGAFPALLDFISSDDPPLSGFNLVTDAVPREDYERLFSVVRKTPRLQYVSIDGVVSSNRLWVADLGRQLMVLALENRRRMEDLRRRKLRRSLRGVARSAWLLFVAYRDLFKPGGPGAKRAKLSFERAAAGQGEEMAARPPFVEGVIIENGPLL